MRLPPVIICVVSGKGFQPMARDKRVQPVATVSIWRQVCKVTGVTRVCVFPPITCFSLFFEDSVATIDERPCRGTVRLYMIILLARPSDRNVKAPRKHSLDLSWPYFQ